MFRINYRKFKSSRSYSCKKTSLTSYQKLLKPNVSFDADFYTEKHKKNFKNISYTKGKLLTGELIILKGDIVEGEN